MLLLITIIDAMSKERFFCYMKSMWDLDFNASYIRINTLHIWSREGEKVQFFYFKKYILIWKKREEEGR